MAIRDDADFRRAWSQVSRELTWNQRPSARRLWQLARLARPGAIVEIGSFLGNSTIYLVLAGGEVHAVDPHTPQSMVQLQTDASAFASQSARRSPDAMEPSEIFLRNLERFGVRGQVVYHRAPSVEAAASWSAGPIRLLYIDGLHTYEAVIQDYRAWEPFLAEEHVVLFDDYLWAEVQRAVDDLCAQATPRFFYVRGGQAVFSTTPLPTRVIGLP
jgi:predicted O-methyltransferase YrrM